MQARVWALDALRGLAVAGMVLYHLLWDASFFGLLRLDMTRGLWLWVARAGGSLFLWLVGVSMALAAARWPASERDRRWRSRGLKLWGWALVITLATRLGLGDAYVRFGVLHLIGTALLLAPVLWRLRAIGIGLAAALAAAGLLAGRLASGAGSAWTVPLGITPPGFHSVDYWPVVPWMAAVALGVWSGPHVGRWLAATAPPTGLWRPVCWLGRHSLVVYLLHQPLLLALFALVGLLKSRS